jgi:hypothetical protein
VLGVLDHVSAGVEAPKEHRDAGLVVASPSDADDPLLHVRSERGRPRAAPLAVSHRGSWFFIDDADLASKRTFVLLAHLYALQAAPISLGPPTLTLPAGR